MRKITLLLVVLLGITLQAQAQLPAQVKATCPVAPVLTAGTTSYLIVDATGAVCLSAVTIAGAVSVTSSDGALATLGNTTDSKSSAVDNTAATLIAIEKEHTYDFETGGVKTLNFYGNGVQMLPTDVPSVSGNLTNNNAAIGANRLGTLPAVARSNYPSAYTTGRDAALTTDLSGALWVGNLPTGLPTYVAASSGSLAGNPTDIAVLPGNATNTVMVTEVVVSCTQTTAAIQDVTLRKRSTADSGGTSSAMTVVPMDSNNAAGVSAPLFYTGNPASLGTLVGQMSAEKIGMMAPGTASPNDIYIWRPTMGQTVVLRGTAQQLAVNLNAQTITGAICAVSFTWIETTGL